MAILPTTMHPNWWADEDFGALSLGPYLNNTHGIRHDDVLAPHMPFAPPHIMQRHLHQRGMLKSMYARPWLRNSDASNIVSTVKAEKDQFHAVLDMLHFMPDEITVKVVDKFVLVEGKHDEKQDEHGWISRRFSRKYQVPEEYDLHEVKSSLSSDGVLTITAPRKYDPKHHREKHISIEVTGKPVAREILEAMNEEKKLEKK
ncbi:protein lethal(2)essential for life-like [Belonocnema kinseyi]|uniref:protein lethal(2)essential for life-like n=1 Tax=Belonocnema kinseyi TaxID=2817044 RepID=UPI00143E0386|nr:protein lethal(2)essential for life-like [Belonocnema kinseyi]